MLDLTTTMLCIFSSEFDVPGGQKKIPISIDKSSLHPHYIQYYILFYFSKETLIKFKNMKYDRMYCVK